MRFFGLLCCTILLGCPGQDPSDTGGELPMEWPVNETCFAPERPAADVVIESVKAHPSLPLTGLTQTVFAYQFPHDPDAWLLGQQSGEIWRIVDDPAVTEKELFIDLAPFVKAGMEEGLLDIAISPNFDSDGSLYVSYTEYSASVACTSIIARLVSPDGGVTFPLDSLQVLLEVPQPSSNHNGGQIAFGPDGFLYFGLGDGGGAGDPLKHGQNPGTLLGSLLRIDVDVPTGYAIPEDNPFLNGGAPEVYAYGFRNPWRFSFDSVTGELWLGDVGQYSWEEIDRVERGGNYGWNIKEGAHCYVGSECDDAGLIDPFVEYSHDVGWAVVGGFVYRGEDIPKLYGRYLFTDYYNGSVMAVTHDEETGAAGWEILTAGGLLVSAFAQDLDNEMYLVGYSEGLHKIINVEETTPSTFPEMLSETGCVDSKDPSKPAQGMVPYQPAAPFWSDGAEKRRWLALPPGEEIAIGVDGDWQLPVGSVTMKQFEVDGKLVETRFMVRHKDGNWAGYTYVWNEEQTGATFVANGTAIETAGGLWSVPGSGACLHCHTEAAGRTLGLESAQLDLGFDYGQGEPTNQLETLHELGLIGDDWGQYEALVDPHGDADLEARARAYLHTNCAQCHRPEGGTPVEGLDLRYGTSLSAMGACDVDPIRGDLGIPGAKLIVPGNPANSIVVARMASDGAGRMPPLGSSKVDEPGVQLLTDWIGSLSSCAP